MLSTKLDMEVPFFDVDAYRIVWHGNYPKYFEIARCQLLEEIGYPYQRMEESGYFFPVIDMHIRYVKPIVFKQRIQVKATLKQWENKLVIDYLITDQVSGDRLTKGQTQQVAVLMPDNITQFQSPREFIEHIESRLPATPTS
ncbi:acyl-CoA thioesterase [Arenicella xantha]|uniref:Acyl-CoA thioester hydrolase n=1 Tax=Arenicella xantha TaxID=644221 RepID=A0A395JPX9_9GAMM|nr:acyl-CoA thioesterase [Arenicella xantha]RBP53704.1 acyl-CoA thioester hydrolase [Arenicella xantha]